MSLSEVEALAGMTRRVPGPGDAVTPACSMGSLDSLLHRKVLLLATASICDGNMFNNGLYQNCFLLYRLAEAIGWLPIFVVNKKPETLEGIPELIRPCRIAEIEDILKTPLTVKIYLEVGMSISDNLRRFMKLLGARTCKLYLGNILNIDIETPMFFSGIHFSHHVVGEQDEIWTSPHYGQNMEYAACLNKVEPNSSSMKIAPYVWDPCILTDDGRRNIQWRPRNQNETPCIIIVEPNISFQKTAFIPLLIAESYSRAHPDSKLQVVVLNGDRLLASGYYKNTIEPCLDIATKGFIQYAGRNDILSILKAYPHATAICHHMNNEFNYMVLEFLHAGFPVIQNCRAWEKFGYFYPDNSVKDGVIQLEDALMRHHEKLETYKSHSRALTWRHSIYNPDVQKAWLELLEGSVKN